MFEMVIGVHDASVSEILQLFISDAVTLAGKGTAHYIADRILHEEGSYAELMEKDGKFANLVRKQINTAKEKAAVKK